ncbi:hypothetical protein JTB14_027955 [Gonioctena quinquepunctata]|nr:hypothetical protein JTB14_027955 [Gonioctena quinquepunctata]
MAKSKVIDIPHLLRKSIGFNFEIMDQSSAPLTAPGEHYGSVMLVLDLRVRCSNGNEEKTLNLIAKLLPKNETLRIAFDVQVTFKKEVHAYTEAIPAIVEFQEEFNLPKEGSFDKLFPKNALELELVGFDFNATKIILKDLAKFHAISLALKRIKPDVFEKKIMPCLVKNTSIESFPENVRKAFVNSIMEGAREVPELQPYMEKLQDVCDHVQSFEQPLQNEQWLTMCHTDFWTSNTMLRKDKNGKPIENKIVDLQLMRCASCLRDLVFFLFTSVMNDFLEKHFEDFLQIYYDSFLATLREFDIDLELFSWECFKNELENMGRNEIYHILVMLKPICTERDKIQNTAENFQDSDWCRKDLLGPNHRRKLRDTVLAFVKRGWL